MASWPVALTINALVDSESYGEHNTLYFQYTLTVILVQGLFQWCFLAQHCVFLLYILDTFRPCLLDNVVIYILELHHCR